MLTDDNGKIVAGPDLVEPLLHLALLQTLPQHIANSYSITSFHLILIEN